MSDEYGSDFITIVDEDGSEFELEHLDTMEWNDETYMAFLPAEEADPAKPDFDDEEYGLIILKVVEEDGEEQLVTLDSEEELEAVYQLFMERIFEDEEE
ncbi:MAG: DUF1292 domain-containing protein [Oscillospiraceae bacterium]|nr:DUF1292 domain-containing protein [Oscillospiraceae bacterium]